MSRENEDAEAIKVTTQASPRTGADANANANPELDAPLRFLVVDDAASTRLLLRGVLDYCPEFDVVGEADNGSTALEMAEMLQPDVILLDLSMPVVDGSAALSGLLLAAPNSRVIVLTGADPKAATAVLAAGASGFVSKGLAPFDLIDELAGILGHGVTFQ